MMQPISSEASTKNEVYEKLKIHFEYIQRMQPKRRLYNEPVNSPSQIISQKSQEAPNFFTCCFARHFANFFLPFCPWRKKNIIIDNSNIW